MEMHKVNPEPQKGLSLELIEAALNVQLDGLKRIRPLSSKPEEFIQVYQAFIALRQAQAMEEAVNQLISIRIELYQMNDRGLVVKDLNLGKLTARVEALEVLAGRREPVDDFDPFEEEYQPGPEETTGAHRPDCSCAFCMPQEGDWA